MTMTPHLDALAKPSIFGWPEPSAQTKTTTEALLAALVPLLGSVKPYACSGSHATLVVEAGVGARILAFFVLDETTTYLQSDYSEGGDEWPVDEGLLKDDGKLRELVAWLVGAA